jgi:hypothetical protein
LDFLELNAEAFSQLSSLEGLNDAAGLHIVALDNNGRIGDFLFVFFARADFDNVQTFNHRLRFELLFPDYNFDRGLLCFWMFNCRTGEVVGIIIDFGIIILWLETFIGRGNEFMVIAVRFVSSALGGD